MIYFNKTMRDIKNLETLKNTLKNKETLQKACQGRR